MNSKRPTLRHIIIKLSEDKDTERILKASRKKCFITYKGSPRRISADFSSEIWRPEVFLSETLEAKRQWANIFKVLKEENGQPRILYLAKLPFRREREVKIFQINKS